MALSLDKTAAIPIGQSREESQKLLDQTTSALQAMEALKSDPLDLSAIEDVSEILHSAASGQLLTVRELSRVRRMLRASRAISEKLVGSPKKVPRSGTLHCLRYFKIAISRWN